MESINDKGGRRSGFDRRFLVMTIAFMDRRSGPERRSGMDRRSGLERRSRSGYREIVGLDRRKWFKPKGFAMV